MHSRRRKWPTDLEILAGIEGLAGDGYCPAYDLHLGPFRDRDRAAVRSGLRRAVSHGLVLELRGPDGRRYVGIAAEGWRVKNENSESAQRVA
jgi:hypothetical protein